jgi:GDP-L-fucose synthase
MKPDARIFVAGHRGLAGSAIVRKLRAAGFDNLLLVPRDQLDLSDGQAVTAFFAQEQPEYVIVAAAKVGGILANEMYPADFIRENLAIALNVIDAAYRFRAAKLLFLSSSCVYPKHAPQPMREEYLLAGPLEPTNEPYAIAKIAGMKLCESYQRQYGVRFFSVLPTNLYGPNDNFDLETSHVLPALLRRFHDAKAAGNPYVTLWGSGQPRREFMHVDDLAEACVFLMQHYDGGAPINIGVGTDLTIADLATLIGGVVGFNGQVRYDRSKPDGAPRKLLDTSRINKLGWSARISLHDGISETYRWFRAQTFVNT